MSRNFWASALSLALAVVLFSCDNSTPPADYLNAANCSSIVDSTNTYNKAIKAIMTANCAFSACHDAATAKEGVDLSTYANTKKVFDKGNGLCSIHHGTGCKSMPDGGGKLSDSDINKIDCWAKNGYKE